MRTTAPCTSTGLHPVLAWPLRAGPLFRFAPCSTHRPPSNSPRHHHRGDPPHGRPQSQLEHPAPLARAAEVKTNGFFFDDDQLKAQPSATVQSHHHRRRGPPVSARGAPGRLAPRVGGFRDADGRLSMNAHQWLGIGAYASVLDFYLLTPAVGDSTTKPRSRSATAPSRSSPPARSSRRRRWTGGRRRRQRRRRGRAVLPAVRS